MAQLLFHRKLTKQNNANRAIHRTPTRRHGRCLLLRSGIIRPVGPVPVIADVRQQNNLVTTIRTFTDPVKAGIVASFLRDKNIDVVLLDENGNLSNVRYPVRLQVPETQVDKARFHLEGISTQESKQRVQDERELSLFARIFLGALLLIGLGWLITSLFR